MNNKVIDCSGLACPAPVINTKKALEEGGFENLLVIVDNEAAKENVTRFAGRAGCSVAVENKDGAYHLTIKPAGERPAVSPASPAVTHCGAKDGDGVVYFITTNSLGQGSPDLGEVLMKSLMVTISEQQPPAALLLLNTGIYLAVEDSPVLEQLQKIAGQGTEVLVCGTCLDYYKLKEKLAVGVVSNMFDINSHLIGPGKVIAIS